MKRIGLVLLIVGAVAASVWFALFLPPVEAWLFREIAFRAVAQPTPVLARKGELSVLLCGTGSPLPDKTRGGPCTLIAAGDKYYLVDTGLDTARDLILWRVPLQNIAGVLLTHFHSDHIGDLGEVKLQTWVAGRKTQLAVYGPPGVERVVNGFNEAYALDDGYRTKHHGAALLPPDIAAMTPHAVMPGTVLDQDGLKITAFKVHHEPANPAYAYRFDFHGRSIVVSGDTAPDEDLFRANQNVDIMVHEALSPEMVGVMHEALIAADHPRQAKIFHDIPGYHTSPLDAARLATKYRVRALVFTHLIPILPNVFAEKLFLRGVSDVRPGCCTILGHDGLVLQLQEDSDDIDGKMDLN